MIIATFTSGNKTLIGYRKNGEEDNIKTIDSRILFEDPDKLVGRFLSLLSNLFGIKSLSENDKLVFVISGIVDAERKKIIMSDILNELSSSKLFNGYDFVEAFGEKVGAENIFLVNDADCVAVGVISHAKEKFEFPALLIYIDEGVGVSIIKDSGIVNYGNSIRPITHLENNAAQYLLCDQGIDDILFDNWEDLSEKYTVALTEVIKDILHSGIDDGFNFKKIFVHSNRSEFILEGLAKDILSGMDISFTDGMNMHRWLPLKGAFNCADEEGLHKPNSIFNNKITKIEYSAATDDIIHTFNKFQKFAEHWHEAKPIAYGKNYYRVHYSDGTKMKVELDSLSLITDLQKYKF